MLNISQLYEFNVFKETHEDGNDMPVCNMTNTWIISQNRLKVELPHSSCVSLPNRAVSVDKHEVTVTLNIDHLEI